VTHKQNQKEVEMESNTNPGIVVDFGSLFARFQALSDKRKPRGMRYSLAMVLTLVMMAKLCGENHFMGIAEWAKHRAELLVDLLQLKREKMPHHSTYRRILADVVNVEEIEKMKQ
jgi:hypothetical protein